MLPRMTTAKPDQAPPSMEPAPSAIQDAPVGASLDLVTPRGCPFLLGEGGGWRLDLPSRDHRCGAVSPAAALSPEKQARLCLTASHATCATYVASVGARGARLGTPMAARTTRWALARTTTVIEDAGGVRARLTGLLLDRRRWPAIPAVILVGTLFVLAVSGFNAGGVAPGATATPARPSATPALTPRQSTAPTSSTKPDGTPTAAPSPAPTAQPSPIATGTQGPGATFRTYRVKSGDTLSAIAARFGTTSRAIAELNGITVSTILHAGDILRIPN